MGVRAWWLGLALLVGCQEPVGQTLVVDVRTNLRLGVAFDRAVTTVHAQGTGTLVEEVQEVFPSSAPVLARARAAEVTVAPGVYRVETWLAQGPDFVAGTAALVTVREPTVARLVIASDCAGLDCGRGPGADACLGGRCADPACAGDFPPAGCPDPECALVVDCPAAPACADRTCATGVCFAEPDDDRCPAGWLCDVEAGCVAPPGTDAGVPLLDAGIDAGSSDAGPSPCAPPCGAGEVCVAGACRCGGTGPDCRDEPTDTCCGTTCVDTTTDEGFCGSCGIACDAGEQCVAGACSCGGTGPDCDGSATSTCCGSACVDTTADLAHCGGCNVACGGAERCAGGVCACGPTDGRGCTFGGSPSNQNHCCGGECVRTTLDRDHCGGCGLACRGAATCERFSPGSGFLAHCTGCATGADCPTGQTCGAGGVCRCAAGAGCPSYLTCDTGPGACN